MGRLTCQICLVGFFCCCCYIPLHPWPREKENCLLPLIIMHYTQAASQILHVWKVIKKKNLERKYFGFHCSLAMSVLWGRTTNSRIFQCRLSRVGHTNPIIVNGICAHNSEYFEQSPVKFLPTPQEAGTILRYLNIISLTGNFVTQNLLLACPLRACFTINVSF